MIIFATYFSTEIINRRRVKYPNRAASKRINKIAGVLGVNSNVRILSLAPNYSLSSATKKYFRQYKERDGLFEVKYLAHLDIPILSLIYSSIMTLFELIKLRFESKNNQVLFYNYYPHSLFGMISGRLLGLRVIGILEDISLKNNSNVGRKNLRSYYDPLAFILFCYISKWIIVPTETFKEHIKDKEKVIFLPSYCDSERVLKYDVKNSNKMNLLFSGSLTNDQGLNILLEALPMIHRNDITVTILGIGDSEQIVSTLKKLGNKNFKYLGYVDESVYWREVSRADVCLVLQNPYLHSSTKIPSKIFDFICNEKVVLHSDLPYINALVKNSGFLLNEYSSLGLADFINGLEDKEVKIRLDSARKNKLYLNKHEIAAGIFKRMK